MRLLQSGVSSKFEYKQVYKKPNEELLKFYLFQNNKRKSIEYFTNRLKINEWSLKVNKGRFLSN